jgi:hypothetical protein
LCDVFEHDEETTFEATKGAIIAQQRRRND